MDIICLQEGTGKTSAFLLPTVAGSVNSYYELARALGPGYWLYGVQCADRDQAGRFKTFTSLEDMAAAIADELMTRHDGAPICLIGYSFGAALALELAHQLTQRGELVPLVVMIDRIPPLPSLVPALQGTIHNWIIRTIKVTSKIITDPKTWVSYCRAAMRAIRRHHAFEEENWFLSLPPEHQNYVRGNLANLKKYRFNGEYLGKILLLTGETIDPASVVWPDRSQRQEYDSPDPEVSSAEFEMIPCPGDHVSMMQQPNVAYLANELRLALDECELRSSGAGDPSVDEDKTPATAM